MIFSSRFRTLPLVLSLGLLQLSTLAVPASPTNEETPSSTESENP